ncbi:MAG: hypothetical protein HZA20_14175 [Nitrospirae bacterium]|nr:hypothetical protein [Nitrospirota bacterium]
MIRFKAYRFAVAAVLLASAIGCVSTSTFDMKVSELEETRRGLDALQAQHSALKQRTAAVTEERDRFSRELEASRKETGIANTRIAELERKLEAARSEAGNLDQRVLKLKEELETSRSTLTAQIAELMEKSRALSNDNVSLSRNIDVLLGDVTSRDTKLRNLNETIAARDDEIRRLSDRVVAADADVARLITENARLGESLKAKEAEAARLTAENARVSEAYKALETESKRLADSLREREDAIRNLTVGVVPQKVEAVKPVEDADKPAEVRPPEETRGGQQADRPTSQ